MPPVGVDVDLFLRNGPDHTKLPGLQLLSVLAQGLVQKLAHADFLPVHRQHPRRRLAGLHQVLRQLFQPQGLPVQHLDIFHRLGVGLLCGFQQIDIVDNRRQGRFQVVRHIGNQLSLEALAFHLLLHRAVHPHGNIIQILRVDP